MNYTKGERRVVYNATRDKFEVRVFRDGDMCGTLASFTNEQDALLDSSAPDLYEALKRVASQYALPSNKIYWEAPLKALAKAEGGDK